MKRIFLIVLFSLFLILITTLSFANTFDFEIVDTSNDLKTLQSYNIYQKIGDGSYFSVVIVSSDDAAFSLTFNNNTSYTLTATAIDKQGLESPKSAELQIVIDQNGNPTFPGGPMPPTMITIIR